MYRSLEKNVELKDFSIPVPTMKKLKKFGLLFGLWGGSHECSA